MRARYTIRPARETARIYHDDGYDFDETVRRSCDVHEPEDEPIATGLLDMHGNELMRNQERRPIGFLHAYEPKTP